MLFFQDKASAQTRDGQSADALGEIVPLDPFIVNLNESDSTRYLKLNFSLELNEDGSVDELKMRRDVVRDHVLTYLSGLTTIDVRGSETKDAIRKTLAKRINNALGETVVQRVLFTEFVVQ